ncbi:MAG: sigma-54 dependent transcriptional regulator [Candidatus Cloacimonetes bacterium]|nr:sigma-54 dependent transcriptional regulator [Candidatus Cloacimonadota bacterium]
MKKKILIADDEPLIRQFIVGFFESTEEFGECVVDVAVNGDEAISRIRENQYNLVFTDLKMPGRSGLDVIRFAHEHSPRTDSVLITAYAAGESASKAMAYGAYEYLIKPVSIDDLELIVRHIFERQDLIRQNEDMKRRLHEKTVYPRIIGRSKALADIMDVVKMVAPTNATVLITGESGTGKELVAEAVHRLSPKRDGMFVRINCAAIPEHLIESELFGFEKGAFTGAIKRTRGKFEMADGGSILLDEISEMNLDLQAKLLRVIQFKEILRIGSEMPKSIDTRIIATSNRDLSKEVKEGRFREDLFFRLNIVPLRLPLLRDRRDDIPLLVDHFVKHCRKELGVGRKAVPATIMSRLVSYNWPGNIRELQNVIERAMITSPGDTMLPETFHFLDGFSNAPIVDVQSAESGETVYDNLPLAEVEKRLILRTLERLNGNRTETATILGITTRTLRNKLHQYEGLNDTT